MAQEQLALETYEAQVREDPTNAAARNDLAIAYFKVAEMLEAEGRTREALASLERAATIQDQLAAADPENARARAETATNDAMRGRLLAKLGQRAAALASLQRAVDVSRELSQGNPDNVELRVAVALALIERADAALVLSRQAGSSPADRAAGRARLHRGRGDPARPQRRASSTAPTSRRWPACARSSRTSRRRGSLAPLRRRAPRGPSA